MDGPQWRFTHVHVYASDPQVTVDWLQRLGGEVVSERQHPGRPRSYEIAIGGQLVQVRGRTDAEHFAGTPGERTYGLDHIGLAVDDLDAALEVLRARGIEPETEFTNGFAIPEGIAFLRGPDGLWVELGPSAWFPPAGHGA
jgi:catechol 2,3-dioxygenase-like lactoylglutathione lyase family enzyme